MKKLFACVLILLTLCACSPRNNQKSFSLPEGSVAVSFKEGETTVSGVFFCESSRKMKLKINEPESAKGFEIGLLDSEYSLSFENVSCTLENFENLFGSPKGIQILFETFSFMKNENKNFSKAREKINSPLGEAVVSFDENGNLSSIRAGVYDFEFTAA